MEHFMSLKFLGVAVGIGIAIGAGVVWILTRPTIDELKRRIKLLEDRIYEYQTMYENDLNAIREEYSLLYKQIQELRKTALTPEMKQKVEGFFYTLEQAYQLKQAERKASTYVK